MRIKSFLGTILLFCSLPATALAQELFENGGFEIGTILSCPDGWSCSTSAWARGAGRWIGIPQLITPHSGDRMVILAPGGMGNQQIWQEVNFTGYSLATLSFWWRYEAIDWDVDDYGRDQLELEVWDPNENTPEWDTIWSSPINVDPSDGQVVSPWMFVTFSGGGADLRNLTFRFSLRNAGEEGEGNWPQTEAPFDHGQQTVVFIDDASLKAAVSITDFLGNIAAIVDSLEDSGSLNDGEVNSLSVKLDAAIRAIDRNDTVAAAGQLNAFINEVTAMEKSSRLSPAQSQSLIGPASYAIELLRQ